MPPPLGVSATEPPKKLPPSRPAGSVRKPNWLLQPKIKRFDAPNLKPSSTLPTKASLGSVRTSDIPQPLTFGRRGSTQTPTETSAPHTFSALEGAGALEPGSNVDIQRQGSGSQLASSPTMQDVPRLPPASRAETDAFLNDIMPPEFVALPSFVHLTHGSPLPQMVGTHVVRFLTLECDCTVKYSLPRDGVEPNRPPSIPIRRQSSSISDLLK
jgi:hypothetical protein